MKRNIFKLISVSMIFAFSLFASCEIGLGEAVDTEGPSVTITDPSPRENVMGVFSIRGTVKDDTNLGPLTVTCGGNEWRNIDGTWTVKLENDSTFRPDNDSVWEVYSGGKAANWQIKNIDFSNKEPGDYEIVVSAQDGSGNTSGESKKSRTVIVDKSAPVVTISSPAHKENSGDFDSLTDYEDITKIGNFLTNDFTISGTTTDDNTIVYVDVYLADPEDGNVYFQQRLYQDDSYKAVDEAPSVAVQVDSLRAWECSVAIGEWADLKKQYDLGGKKVLKILTKTKDASGNPSSLSGHGYLCLWKDADKPWLDLHLGAQVDAPLSVYAGSKLLGNAYDDSIVSTVYATIRKVTSAGGIGEILDGYDRKEIYTGTEENNVFFSIAVPEECLKYYIKIEAVDDRGNSANYIDGYIKVEDKTFPSVEIVHEVSGLEKSNSETIFGDENGNFTFVVTAKDDTKVSSLKIAYMTKDDDIIEYSSKDYPGWADTGTVSQLKEKKTVDLSFEETGIVEENGIKRKAYKSLLPVNIFDDLGINGSEGHRHTNQTFVFRVEDENGNAITKDYTILGDIEAPEILFDRIVYERDQMEFKKDDDGNTVNSSDEKTLLPAFSSGDSITVYGYIRDNAIDNWGMETVKAKWNSSNKKLFSLECNETEIAVSMGEKKLSNGRYYYKFSAKYENPKGSSLVYKATLQDFNNNETIQGYAFLVDTQTLKIEYIYTSKADGCYGDTENGSDTVIPVKIRFNKNLTFTQGADGMPKIRLNNDTDEDIKYWTMSPVASSGEREFIFNYIVKDGGKDVDRLNVTEFILNGGTIRDSNGDVTSEAEALIQSAIGDDANSNKTGINLGDKKKITIIKTLPEITGFTVIPDDDYTKTTVNITYSKAVAKGSGDIIVTQKDVTRVPPVLSENEYKILVAKSPSIADYYEYTTNGATSAFVADLTPKYVLKFDYDSDESRLVDLYKATNNHILTQNIKSNKVTVDSDQGKTVTIILDKLPCKGAEYKIEIPEGFVVDKTGGTAFKAAAYNDNYIFSTEKHPLEDPVIRIKKDNTVVKTVTGGFEATQPLTAKVKIDCETTGVELAYFYNLSSVGKRLYKFVEGGASGTGLDSKPSATSERTPNIGSTTYTAAFDIGDSASRNGLTYQITAIASKNGETTTGYEVAQRTTIQIENNSDKLDIRNSKLANNYENWPGADITGNNVDSKKLGLFLRGGDNPTGGNTTPGLPTSWSPSDLDKAILFTEDTTDKNFYIVSWKITKNLYFMPLAGLMDDDTIKDGKYQGPKHTCNAQNRWIGTYATYPAEPGTYLSVENKQEFSVSFEVADAGKAKTVR